MRKALAAAIAGVALFPTTGHAVTVANLVGTTCALVGTIQDGEDHINAVIAATAVGVDSANVTGNPMTVSVTCEIVRNGVIDGTYRSINVPGAAVLATSTGFPWQNDDVMTICTARRASNAFGVTSRRTCADVGWAKFGPLTVYTLLPTPYFD